MSFGNTFPSPAPAPQRMQPGDTPVVADTPSIVHLSDGSLLTAQQILSQIIAHNYRCEKVPTGLTDTLYAIMCQQPDVFLPQLFKWRRGQVLTHVRSGGQYVITDMPWESMNENTGELQYGYRRVERVNGPMGVEYVARGIQYLRSQREMEDGRFY